MYVALSGPKGHESVTIREDYTTADGKKKIRILETLGPLSKLGGDDPEGYLAALKAEMKEKTRLLKEEVGEEEIAEVISEACHGTCSHPQTLDNDEAGQVLHGCL